MKYIAHIVVSILAVLCSCNYTASACSFSAPETIEAQIQGTQVIFRGRAITTTLDKNGQYSNFYARTTFRVDEVWKGPKGTYITINHLIDEATCGIGFPPNIPILVFASMDGSGNYFTSLPQMPMNRIPTFNNEGNIYEGALKELPTTKIKWWHFSHK